MPVVCPNCGLQSRETDRYCSACGTALAPALNDAVSEPEAEPDQADLTAPTYRVQIYEPPSDRPTPYLSSSPGPTNRQQGQGHLGSSGAEAPAPPGRDRFGGIAPGLTSYRERATYTPYSSEAAQHLSRNKSERSWLMPVVVVAAFSLVVLAGVSGYLVLSSRGSGPAASQVGPSSPEMQIERQELGPNATDEEKIREVIRVSNEEQIKAWRELDTEVLKGTRVGEVLAENIEMVETLRRHGIYAVPVNLKLEILDVQVEGDKATAHTREVWTVTFYSLADNKKIDSRGPDKLYETYHLVKQDGKWMVSKVVIDKEKKAPPDSN